MNMIQQNVTTVVLKVISYKFLNKVIIYQCNSIGSQCVPEVLKYFYRTHKYQKKSVLDSRPMVKALEGIQFIFIDKIIYNTYSTSQSTIWENILRARKIFSRAKGE